MLLNSVLVLKTESPIRMVRARNLYMYVTKSALHTVPASPVNPFEPESPPAVAEYPMGFVLDSPHFDWLCYAKRRQESRGEDHLTVRSVRDLGF